MRELTIRVPDELFGTVKKLVQHLRGAEITGTRKVAETPAFTPEQQEFIDDLKQSLLDAEAFERGELELQPVADHIQELRAEQAERAQAAAAR